MKPTEIDRTGAAWPRRCSSSGPPSTLRRLVAGDEQGGEPADDGEALDDHERGEVLSAAGYGAGDQRAGDGHAQRGAQVGDAARHAGDIALDAFRPGGLHEIARGGEHDPDPDAHEE